MRAIDISDKYPQNASMEKIDLPISHNKVRRDYFYIELMLIAIIGIIHAIFLSVHIVKNSACVDLRNRVVGSRLLIQGIDPYSFFWQTGMSERLLDPNFFKHTYSRITVPPTVLLCVSLISWLEYTDILKVWLVLEWLAVFVMVFLLSWSLRLNTRARAWLLVFVALFTHAPPWLLHVDRGQMYIFYALLFCGAFAFLYKSTMCVIIRKNYFFLSILCMIMLISVWPPAIFILIPLFFSINYFLYGLLTLITGLLFFLVPIYILIGSEVWQHYYLSMRGIQVFKLNVVAPVFTPVYIEGMNMIKTYYNIAYSNKFKVALTEMGIHFDRLFLFWGFIAIIVGVYLAKKLYRDKSPTRLFLCGYVIHVLVIMSFFQRTNFSYKAVQWFLPMVLSLWLCLNKKKWDLKYWLAFILILGGFLINFPERLFINNLNLFLSEFFLIIAMLLLLGSDSQNKLRL